MKQPKAIFVAGLGFGDEGKGTMTEYLVAKHQAELVVRYNGGAQAAHNVVTSDGRHHTFAQFGSGTLRGARTHLSRFVVIDPIAILAEAHHLEQLGVRDPVSLLTVDENALLITPYHRIMGRIRDRYNGHGTCGVGVGETRKDAIEGPSEDVVRVGDLRNPIGLREKLRRIRDRKIEEIRQHLLPDQLQELAINFVAYSVDELVAGWSTVGERFKIVVENDSLKPLLEKGTTVFEGAQGVLLDENYGFQPHTTWTNTTFSNAHTLLEDAGSDIEPLRVGVIRTYHTRHGAGPFPTEEKRTSMYGQGASFRQGEKHNGSEGAQGEFRIGCLDLVLLRYALEAIGGVDQIAMTHMDKLRSSANFVCDAYLDWNGDEAIRKLPVPVGDPPEYAEQASLAERLKHARPFTIICARDEFFKVVRNLGEIEAPISYTSYGPCLEDKKEL